MGKTFSVEKRVGEGGRSRLVITRGRHGEGEPVERLEGTPEGELSLRDLEGLGVRVGYREVDDGVEMVFYREDAARTDAVHTVESAAASSTSADPNTPAGMAVSADSVATVDPWASLSDNERIICELVRDRGEVDALEATRAVGMTPRGGIRLLTGLVHKGLLTYEGSGTKKKYHLAQ